METRLLKKEALAGLIEKINAAGRKIYAPVRVGDRDEFRPVDSASRIDLGCIQTTQSAKEVLFPRVERILSFSRRDGAMETADPDLSILPEVVLFGLHPCDAAAIGSLRAIFTWDTQDAFFTARLERLAVIGLSCAEADEYCFCTSVGLGPGATDGSDILLTRLASGDFLAEILTEKGRELAALSPGLFLSPPAGADKSSALAVVEASFTREQVRDRAKAGFDEDALWDGQALRCLGCGACAYVCPTCACFDIQDEGTTNRGVRLRCWDSCGFAAFTLHTSGHNPREEQGPRWRQRIMHKFSYMPERQNVFGCVGCGRCSRACPVDMNIKEHLIALLEARS